MGASAMTNGLSGSARGGGGVRGAANGTGQGGIGIYTNFGGTFRAIGGGGAAGSSVTTTIGGRRFGGGLGGIGSITTGLPYPNTGGGGAGAYQTADSQPGASGIVIIRYRV